MFWFFGLLNNNLMLSVKGREEWSEEGGITGTGTDTDTVSVCSISLLGKKSQEAKAGRLVDN